MAKKAYVGVNNVARKVSKMYVGVNGIARKVKKAYVGVGGVARLFFQLFQYTGLAYHSGNIATLTHAVYENGAASIGNIVIFAGGLNRSSSISSGQAISINTSNTKTVLTGLSNSRGYCYGASNDNYAIFNRGVNHNWVALEYIDYYNQQGTRQYINFTNVMRASTQTGNIARAKDNVFEIHPNNRTTTTQVFKFTPTMTWTQLSTVTQTADNGWFLKGTISDCAIFQNLNTVWKYTDSGTLSNLTNTLYEHQQGYSGTVNDEYLLFGGGYNTGAIFYKDIDCYNATTFTRSTLTESYKRGMAINCSIDRFYLVAGGYDGTSALTECHYYDENLTTHTISQVDVKQCASASLGDKIYYGGGTNTNDTYQSGINYFYLTQ